jgi:hypothetical protein
MTREFNVVIERDEDGSLSPSCEDAIHKLNPLMC